MKRKNNKESENNRYNKSIMLTQFVAMFECGSDYLKYKKFMK